MAEPKTPRRPHPWWVPPLAAILLALAMLHGTRGTADAGAITNARVTLGTAVAGSTTTATITFVAQSALASGTILVTFPGGSSAYVVAPTTVTHAGFNAGTTLTVQAITQTTVTIAVTTTTAPAATAGATLAVTLNGITLPANATTGTIGVLEALSTRDANGGTLDTISGALSFPQLVAGTLTDMALTLSTNAKGGTGTAMASFTIANPIPAGGAIHVTLPPGFAGSASTAVLAGTLVPPAALCTPSCTASLSGQAVTVTIGQSAVARGSRVTLTLSNITNPPAATAGAAFTIRTTTPGGTGVVAYDVDAGQVAGPAIVNASLSGAQVSLGATQAGATTTATARFATDDAWPANGKASITLPAGFCTAAGLGATVSVGSGAAAPARSVAASPPSCGAGGVTFVVERPDGSVEAPAASLVTVAIGGVMNPTSTGPVAYAAGAIRTLASDGTTVLGTAATVGAVQAAITGGTLAGGSVTASPNAAGATATVSVPFLVTNPVPGGGTIQVNFPGDATTVLGTGAYVLTSSPWLATLSGLSYYVPAPGAACTTTPGAGATAVSGATAATGTPTSSVPFIVTLHPSTSIPAGSCVVVGVGQVRLPQVAGRASNFVVTTRLAGTGGATGTLVDTGLASGAATVAPGALAAASVALAYRTSPPDNDAGKAANVTASFTLSAANPLPVGGRVTITFPTSPAPFAFGNVAIVSIGTTTNGTTTAVPGLFTVSPLYVAPDLDLNYAGGSPLAPGTTVTLTLAGLSNPATSSVTAAQPGGTPTSWVVTTRAPASLGDLPVDRTTAAGPVIVPALAGGPGATPAGQATGLGSPTVAFPTGQAGATETPTFRVKLANPLAAGGAIHVSLPADGFDASGASVPGGTAPVTAASGATSNGSFAVTAATPASVTVTYAGGASFDGSATLPAGATVALPVGGIRLPSAIPASGPPSWGTTGWTRLTGAVTVQAQTAAGYLQDRAATATGVTVVPARATAVAFGASPAVTGAPAAFTASFAVGTAATVPACPGSVVSLGARPAGQVSGRNSTCGTVTVTLPATVTMPASLDAAHVTVGVNGAPPWAATAVVASGTSVKLATPVELPAGATVAVAISSAAGIRTPAAGGSYVAKVQTSSSPEDATSAAFTIGAPVSGVTVQPVSPTLVGGPSGGLVIGFTNGAGSALSPGSGTVTVGFPAAFPVPASIARQYVQVNGATLPAGAPITAEARPSGGQQVTIPVPVAIAAGSPVDVAFWAAAGFQVPTHAGPHAITVRTSAAPVDATGTASFSPEPPTRLLLVMPGEVAAPGSAPGKAGTASLASGQPGTVTIRAVDRFYNKAPSTATVSLAYTDPLTALPSDAAGQNRVTLVSGEATFPLTPARPGAYALTATDVAASGPLATASETVTVTAGPPARLLLLVTGETLAPGTEAGIANAVSTIYVASAPATVQATVVATDGTFNQATTPGGYQVTINGATSPATATLVNGTAPVTLTLPAGTTSLDLIGAGPITGTRSLTVTVGAPQTGGGASSGGGQSGGSGSDAPASTPTAAPSPTPVPTPVPALATIPSASVPTASPLPVERAVQAPSTPEANGTPTPADAPNGGPNGMPPATNGGAQQPGGTTPSPTAAPTPQGPDPARDRTARPADRPSFVPESEVVASGARVGFAPGTSVTLPTGTTAEAVSLLPAIAITLPGVGTPPAGAQPLAAFQTIARDKDGGSIPFTARHLVTMNPEGLLGLAPSGLPVRPANVTAFEDRNGRWVPIPTRLDETTGTLVAEASRGLTMFMAFDPATIRPEPDYAIANAETGTTQARFFTQTNGREPGAVPLGFAVADTAGGPALRAEFDRLGGADRLGFPLSAETTFKGFQVQVMQQAVLQWIGDPSGNGGRAVQMNVLDELTASGFDDYLREQLQVPRTFDNAADDGLTMDEVITRHIGFLDDNALTRAAYMANPDHLDDYGLPTAYEEFDDAYVVRTQRAVIRLWKVSRPWAMAGDVTIVGSGDLLKDVAHVAASTGDTPPIALDAFTPQAPPAP